MESVSVADADTHHGICGTQKLYYLHPDAVPPTTVYLKNGVLSLPAFVLTL